MGTQQPPATPQPRPGLPLSEEGGYSFFISFT